VPDSDALRDARWFVKCMIVARSRVNPLGDFPTDPLRVGAFVYRRLRLDRTANIIPACV